MENKLGMGKVEYIAYKTMRFSLTILTIILISILVILFIGLASAISISPSSINIDAYPGETHQINLTIISDGNYVLYFNSTNSYINITPENIITNSGIEERTINLIFSKYIPLGTITFDVTGSTSVQEIVKEVPVQSSGGHSSSHTKTIYKNNTEYVEIPNYINNETIKIIENKTIETEWKNVPTPTKWTWIFAGLFLLLVIIICIIAVRYVNKDSNSSKDETTQDRKEDIK